MCTKVRTNQGAKTTIGGVECRPKGSCILGRSLQHCTQVAHRSDLKFDILLSSFIWLVHRLLYTLGLQDCTQVVHGSAGECTSRESV